jgi:hypothetical protein
LGILSSTVNTSNGKAINIAFLKEIIGSYSVGAGRVADTHDPFCPFYFRHFKYPFVHLKLNSRDIKENILIRHLHSCIEIKVSAKTFLRKSPPSSGARPQIFKS